MEDGVIWQDKLQEALDSRKEWLEAEQLPQLKEQLTIFHRSFESVYNILMKKSVIKEDPYKFEEKITEVAPPPDKEILESEKQETISRYLSSYHTHLEFLNTYYQFSLDFLDLRRIRQILTFLSYFSWANLTGQSANSASHVVNDFVQKVKLGTDSISSQLITDSIRQLDNSMKSIMPILKDMTGYHREFYKLEVRKLVLPNVAPKILQTKDAINGIKSLLPKYIEGRPFYRELIEEILSEENEEGETLKEALLQGLAVRPAKQKKKEVPYKDLLMQAVRILASTGFPLKDVAGKLTENHEVLENRKSGFGARLARIFRFLGKKKQDNKVYEIEYFDASASRKKLEKVAFAPFLEEVKKKSRLYMSLAETDSPIIGKLNAAADEKILEFLNRDLSELQKIHRRLFGFNEYFKSECPPEFKGKMRGFRLEISTLKNGIVKANQKRHEYAAVREEQIQMKRLGVGEEEP